MSYCYVRNSRAKRKEAIVYVMGGRCQICGYNNCISAQELHHIDPSQKELAFNSAANYKWEPLREELKKCIQLCANCHREVHAGKIKKELHSSYDDEKAEEVTKKNKELRTKKIRHCRICGSVVSVGATTCPTCSGYLKRKADRPTREELKDLIRNRPFVYIANKYMVTDNAVRKWCKAFGLPAKKTDICKMTDQEWSEI